MTAGRAEIRIALMLPLLRAVPAGRLSRLVEHAFVERLYDVYQTGPTSVETRSNRCLSPGAAGHTLVARQKTITDH